MSVFTVTAHREGRYWVAEVDGIGVTQGRTLNELREMVADLIAIRREGESPETIAITLEVELPEDLSNDVAEARRLQHEAEALQRRSASLYRAAVRSLRGDMGLTGKDTGQVLGVSEQRVSQLAKPG